MRKSTLFVSGALTIFMLAILIGVVSASQNVVSSTQPEAVVQPQPTAEMQSLDQLISLAPTPAGTVTPEQATTIAMEMIGRSDVYSVESTEYEGAAAYLVTFTSGDLVYVSPTGQIRAVTKLEPVVVVAPRRPHNNDGVQTSRGGEDGEDHVEHEEEHEGGDG